MEASCQTATTSGMKGGCPGMVMAAYRELDTAVRACQHQSELKSGVFATRVAETNFIFQQLVLI